MNKYFSIRLFLLSVFLLITFGEKAFSKDLELQSQKIGNANAKIKIKEYFSLTCSHCANFHIKTFPIIKEKLIDTNEIEFEFVDYPLDRLAMFGVAIVRSLPKESYFDATDLLLKKQKEWAFSKDPVNELFKIAKRFGISKTKFDKILTNHELMQKILDNMEEHSSKFDIQSTPTFIINNQHKISGNLTFKEFKEKIYKLTVEKK